MGELCHSIASDCQYEVGRVMGSVWPIAALPCRTLLLSGEDGYFVNFKLSDCSLWVPSCSTVVIALYTGTEHCSYPGCHGHSKGAPERYPDSALEDWCVSHSGSRSSEHC